MIYIIHVIPTDSPAASASIAQYSCHIMCSKQRIENNHNDNNNNKLSDRRSKTCGFSFKLLFNKFQSSLEVCPCSHTTEDYSKSLRIGGTYYIFFYGSSSSFPRHYRPLPIVQILNDGSSFSFGQSDNYISAVRRFKVIH